MSLTPRRVTLYRDGPQTSWGFRLQGGVDLGQPLTIQRINLGSPSEGELHQGDYITRIENHDTTKMTHQQARNTIKNAGNTINLSLIRTGHSNQNSNHVPARNHSFNLSPLPRTDLSNYHNDYYVNNRFAPPPPQNNPAANNAEDSIEKQMEIHSIVSQPHRTFPLITPSLKVKRDLPTGSYLRHVSDPFAKNRESSMKARVQESVLNAGVAYSSGSSPARSATPDVIGTIGPNTNIVNRQYNSPINMYSHQSMLDTIAGQTGVTPTLNAVIIAAITDLQNLPDGRSFPQNNTSAHKKTDMRFFDITKSPTYQAIYETEWKTLRKKDLAEHRPIQHHVKILPASPIPTCDYVNPLGVPKDKILQSKSFDMITNSLTGQSDF